jgi:hypothetical protein
VHERSGLGLCMPGCQYRGVVSAGVGSLTHRRRRCYSSRELGTYIRNAIADSEAETVHYRLLRRDLCC